MQTHKVPFEPCIVIHVLNAIYKIVMKWYTSKGKAD